MDSPGHITRQKILNAFKRLKSLQGLGADSNNFFIICPDCGNEQCGSGDGVILICESEITSWAFIYDQNKIEARCQTQEFGDYDASTRHLWCTKCNCRWKVPTNAEVKWMG